MNIAKKPQKQQFHNRKNTFSSQLLKIRSSQKINLTNIKSFEKPIVSLKVNEITIDGLAITGSQSIVHAIIKEPVQKEKPEANEIFESMATRGYIDL